jgi:hypothetical protein
MATIKITPRIVGLYFNQPVVISDLPTLTVRDVIDGYIRLNLNISIPGGLEYDRFPLVDDDFVKIFTAPWSVFFL